MEATRYRTITSSMIKIMMVIMMIILVNVQADDHQDYLISIPSNTVTPDDNAYVEDQTAAASPPPPNSVIGDVGRCASECAAMCGRRHGITTGSASTDRFFFPRIPVLSNPPAFADRAVFANPDDPVAEAEAEQTAGIVTGLFARLRPTSPEQPISMHCWMCL
ncbi:hypothetical protein Pyn_39087 [Prunus yedoensis var. nudiflora]|uniref:Uncharacterized protein n=1 Tax=Prunus yedoensis var. nudiflora TaxID=2094558 RepID=A0A314UED9_PRUYE|nr:hypothetical protein Pyn_39087 [Prunus yedoensis var. nudiflora]